MKEIYLNRRELQKIIDFVDMINPPDTMRLGAGSVKITVDDSSGIGSIVKATTVHEAHGTYGEFTITVSDESSW
jgi:hypothetical protein